MNSTPRVHYAWVICLSGALMLFTSLGLGVNVFSVFQPYLLEYAGLSNTQGAWIVTVRSFFILVGMVTANGLAARLGLRLACALSPGDAGRLQLPVRRGAPVPPVLPGRRPGGAGLQLGGDDPPPPCSSATGSRTAGPWP